MNKKPMLTMEELAGKIKKSTFKEEIIEEIGESEVNKAIVVVFNLDGQKFPKKLLNKPVKLKDVIKYFDYERSECWHGHAHNIFIFTKKRVYHILECDYMDSTQICSMPRHPQYSSMVD